MFTDTLAQGLSALGLAADIDLAPFERFYPLVLDWNQRHNLTRITGEAEFIEKHLLDSLSVYPLLPRPATLVDIGTGGGFPGIPLSLYDPAFRVVLVESTAKKTAFLESAIAALGLSQVSVWHTYLTPQRLLPLSQRHGLLPDVRRPQQTPPIVCLSRATHAPEALVALCAPLLTRVAGSILISMQGPKCEGKVNPLLEKELEKCRLSLTIKGPLHLPLTQAERYFYVVSATG